MAHEPDQPTFPPGTFMTYDWSGQPQLQELPPITEEARRKAVLAELLADELEHEHVVSDTPKDPT